MALSHENNRFAVLKKKKILVLMADLENDW